MIIDRVRASACSVFFSGVYFRFKPFYLGRSSIYTLLFLSILGTMQEKHERGENMGLFSRKKKEEPKPIVAEELKKPKKIYKKMNFAIVGLDMKNIDGKKCMTALKACVKEDFQGEPFGGMTSKDLKDYWGKAVEYYEGELFVCELEHYEFEGAPAIRVYFVNYLTKEKTHVGWIAASRAKTFDKKMQNEGAYAAIAIHGVKLRNGEGTISVDWKPVVEVGWREIVEE